MNKKTLSSIVVGILTLPIVALAAISTSAPPINAIGDLPTVITRIETFMWVIFGGIAVVMFVVAGILFLTANGDPEKIASARSAAIWGIAGVVVGIVAYSILMIVGSVIL